MSQLVASQTSAVGNQTDGCKSIRKVMAMTMPDNKTPWTDNLPFPRRWLGYIAIKILVVALAVFLALRWKGVL